MFKTTKAVLLRKKRERSCVAEKHFQSAGLPVGAGTDSTSELVDSRIRGKEEGACFWKMLPYFCLKTNKKMIVGRCGMKSSCTDLRGASDKGGFPYWLESTSWQCFWKAAQKQKFLKFLSGGTCSALISHPSAHLWFLDYSPENWVIVQEFSVQKRVIVEGKQAEEWENLGRKKERKNTGYNLKGYLWVNKTDLPQVKRAIFLPLRVTITPEHNLHVITQNCRLLSFGL